MKKNFKKVFNQKNNKRNTIIGISSLIAIVLSILLVREFTPTNPNGITSQTCASTDSVTVSGGDWVARVGGSVASSHCARVRYQLPENAGVALTSFYLKSVIILPPDFYSKMYAGFRIMNTDNFPTTLNGIRVGAKDEDEMRVGLWIYNSDKKLHFRIQHETYADNIELYLSPQPLPVGQHTLEIWGDVSKVAPWGLKVDGVLVASGNRKLCNSSNIQSECVITRVMAGIDGAASADSTFFELRVRSISVSDGIDVIGVPSETPVTPSTPTSIPVTVSTNTNTPIKTNTPTPTFTLTNVVQSNTPTSTPTITKTNTFTQTSTGTSTITPTPTFLPTLTPECFRVSSGVICFYVDR